MHCWFCEVSKARMQTESLADAADPSSKCLFEENESALFKELRLHRISSICLTVRSDGSKCRKLQHAMSRGRTGLKILLKIILRYFTSYITTELERYKDWKPRSDCETARKLESIFFKASRLCQFDSCTEVPSVSNMEWNRRQ